MKIKNLLDHVFTVSLIFKLSNTCLFSLVVAAAAAAAVVVVVVVVVVEVVEEEE
jgi:hypothetical protein